MVAEPGLSSGDEAPTDRRGGSVHVRIFRLLLRLYPRRFRDAYGEEMTRFFVQRLERARQARRRFAVLRLCTRTFVDLTKTAAIERGDRSKRIHDPARGRDPMSSFVHDVRYAARRLRRAPLFSLSAVAVLAVGIGLNAAVFNLVDTALFRPPPFDDPESIVHIYQDSDDGEPSSTSFPAYRDMAAVKDVFAAVAATSSGGATWGRRSAVRARSRLSLRRPAISRCSAYRRPAAGGSHPSTTTSARRGSLWSRTARGVRIWARIRTWSAERSG